MAKKVAKRAAKKKTDSTSTTKKSAKAKRKGPAKGSQRMTYSEALQKKVVNAVKKGMTYLEASKAYEVGIHSIPNWLKKHGK